MQAFIIHYVFLSIYLSSSHFILLIRGLLLSHLYKVAEEIREFNSTCTCLSAFPATTVSFVIHKNWKNWFRYACSSVQSLYVPLDFSIISFVFLVVAAVATPLKEHNNKMSSSHWLSSSDNTTWMTENLHKHLKCGCFLNCFFFESFRNSTTPLLWPPAVSPSPSCVFHLSSVFDLAVWLPVCN